MRPQSKPVVNVSLSAFISDASLFQFSKCRREFGLLRIIQDVSVEFCADMRVVWYFNTSAEKHYWLKCAGIHGHFEFQSVFLFFSYQVLEHIHVTELQ